jgi:hypothetical protein
MDESRIEAERNVVQEQSPVRPTDVDALLPSGERAQRGERIVAIETQVTREVVPGSEGDDDERDLTFDGDLGYPGQRAVAAGDSQRTVRCARKLGGIVLLGEDMRRDPESLCLGPKL